MECPKCRREIKGDISSADLVFCPYCGENMAVRDEDGFSFCPSCGQKLPSGAVFCPRCGKSMKAPENPRFAQEPQKQRAPQGAPVQHVAPSREDIAELVSEEVAEPSADSQTEIVEAKAQPESVGEPLWPKIKARLGKMVEPLRDFVSGHWRLRRLYHKWAKDGVFAPGEIPSAGALNQITKDSGAQPMQPTRMILIILAAIVFVVFFLVIGITMNQCR